MAPLPTLRIPFQLFMLDPEAQGNPQLEFAALLFYSTPKDRLSHLSDLSDPHTCIRPWVWAYSFVFEHMLACIGHPQAMDHLDLLEAAEIGYNKALEANLPEMRLVDHITEIKVKCEGPMSSRIQHAHHLLEFYREAAPGLRISKALSRMVSHGGDEECSICHESLQNDTTDKQWNEANPEIPFELTLQALNPDFLINIFNSDDWDETASRPRSPVACQGACLIVRRLDLPDRIPEQKAATLARWDEIVENIRGAFIPQREAKRAKEDAEKATEPEKFVVELPCKHKYHRSCIRRWLEKEGTCPCCRLDIAKIDKSSPLIDEDAVRTLLLNLTRLAQAMQGYDIIVNFVLETEAQILALPPSQTPSDWLRERVYAARIFRQNLHVLEAINARGGN